MHDFCHLVADAVKITLEDSTKRYHNISMGLMQKATTPLVVSLKALQVQRAILVTGMFSMFDAELQKQLSCHNGFKICKKYLQEIGENELVKEFQVFIDAINVLKHGKGRSYNNLVEASSNLPFNIKMPNQNFFFEGDVSEIDTLIEVDDKFINDCVILINKISSIISSNESNIKV